MNTREAIENLKKDTKLNPAAEAVFALLAERERSRQTLSVSALYQGMKLKGHSYSREEYRDVLRTLASKGFGTLTKNRRGNIKALEGIQVNLMTLGKAMCGQRIPQEVRVRTPNKVTSVKAATLTLNLSLNDKPVSIQFSQGVTPEELSMFLNKLHIL